MLEFIQLDKKIDKELYSQVFPDLKIRLGACQRAAREAGVPVVIVFEGWDAAGKGGLINRLTQSLDPRGFKVHATSAPDASQRRMPWMTRFWNALPAAGNIAIFDRSWYGRVTVERVEKLIPKRQWRRAFEEIQQFERQLVESGTVIVKFWLHIDKKEQKSRFKEIEKDPAVAWKVGKAEWKRHKNHDKWLAATEEMLAKTGTGIAPWTVIEATQGRFARTKVFREVIGAVESELERRKSQPEIQPTPMPEPPRLPPGVETILDRIDLTQSIEREDYEQQLDKLQKRVFQLEHELYAAQIPTLIVYEGSDAGGKGGNIKRLTRGLDPRGYEVIPVGAPNAEERAHHYLWRFWKDVPKSGHITIFDRSWYGRVLVERVEGFCREEEWRRAYREINEFERQLADFGTVVIKFWLHIDQEEQLRRFEARQGDANKEWKITDEDWRNREKWAQYKTSIVDMLQKTSTNYAPWTILEANCKLFSRIKALKTVADRLEDALGSA